MRWFERQIERLRSIDPLIVDGVLAVLFALAAIPSITTQELDDDFREPTVLAVLTALLVCAPVAVRRRTPVAAVVVASAGILLHILAEFPEGSLPLTVLFLTYSAAAWGEARRATIALAVVLATLVVLGVADSPGLDTLGVVANIAFFSVAWTIGLAVRARREAVELRVREADERANVEQQRAARVLAEERLRIAQELHDVVAHSMSVIAVQAGVGAHVLDQRPEQARAALEAISATSRGALTEMRRLLNVLRDGEGERSKQPAPGLADVPRLVDEVRTAGLPVSLDVQGSPGVVNPAVELSAYRVVQEALTNVIKHAGNPTRVCVTVRHEPGAVAVEVVDDGRGAAAVARGRDGDDSGHGLIGMRERVELWGGELTVGPVTGGGYRVQARLPYGEPA